MLVVLTTTSSDEEAEKLADGLVSGGHAACVQILPKMTSVYIWKGEVQKEPEHLLLIKTLPENYDAVEKFILEIHSYETPEIVAIPAERVSKGYSDWLAAVL